MKSISSSNALFALSAFVAALTLARIVLGKLLRMYKPLRVMVLGFFLALAGYILLYWGESYYTVLVALIAIGFGLAAAFPVILGYVGDIYTRHSGTAFSIVITIALIGNVIANYTLGQVSEQSGLTIFPWFLIIGVLTIYVLVIVLKKQDKSKVF